MTLRSLSTEVPHPTRRRRVSFFLKSRLLALRHRVCAARPPRFSKTRTLVEAPIIARSVTPLRTETHPSEQALQFGKIQNLRVALRRLDGLEIPAGAIFSFWRHVGWPGRARGFVQGRELREGCLVPSIGGGLCQLSNALYDAALQAGFSIVERHAHTRVLAGSLAEQDRDATVFWNYVDLRFRSPAAFRLEARLSAEHLHIIFKSHAPAAATPFSESVRASEAIGSCASCGVRECFQAQPVLSASSERQAFLLDAFWPEYDRYLQENRRADDWLGVPLPGGQNYPWSTAGFREIRSLRALTWLRAFHSRRLARQGGARQRMLLRYTARFARAWAKKLPTDATHVVVAQNLLPFLWESGALGGRTFDVLMTGYPIAHLHALLDRAARLHGDCLTLADFRAPENIAQLELAALARARRLITPHREVARLFPDKTVRLDWHTKSVAAAAAADPRTVLFPASTLARKGACELREAARALDLRVVLGGPILESADFWHGVKLAPGAGPAVVVLPSFVEHQPRALLRALAAGLPVIATPPCGLPEQPGLTLVPAGDVAKLVAALEKQFAVEAPPFSLLKTF